MSELLRFAEEELDRIGVGDEDADYDGMLKTAVMEIMRVFSEQGHSGFSAGLVTSMVEKLMRFEPLSPLTGEEDEWTRLDYSPDMAAQNRRCSTVFKRTDGTAYNIEGRIFREPNGVCYTSKDSHVDISFPYVPTREYVDVPLSG